MNDEQQIIEPVPTMAGYKKIPTFKLWIANQFPYIETDFDAITNYELLQAVIKYLNTIIENENNVESNVTALYNAFVNLHDYVETFFENLDVQDEVNTKLDEMVEDGTLESLLLNYSQVTKVFDTYTDMIFDTSTYVNGMKLKTLGYYTINDGGGAEYVVTGAPSNNSYYINIGLNKYIEMILKDNTLHSKQIGLKGDNTTDETTALNNFYDLNIKGNKVLDEGIYLITGPVYIKGLWRQSSSNSNNGFVKFTFDKATFNYQGIDDGNSIIIYNLFHQEINGLSLSRYSKANVVTIIGSWHTSFKNLDIKNLNIITEILRSIAL